MGDQHTRRWRGRPGLPGFYRESIVRNAVFLQASNLVMSGLGFVFWIIAAREFPKYDVGVATVLLTAGSLLSSIGLLGLDSSIVRFLPSAERSDEHLNATFTIVLLATTVAALCYVGISPEINHDLAFLRDNVGDAAVFIAFTVSIAVNAIIQSTFISKRRALFVMVTNSIFSVSKICFLPALVAFGSFGIMGASWAALLVGLLFGLGMLSRSFQMSVHPTLHWGSLRRVRTYAGSLLVGGILSSTVVAAIPVIVLDFLGASQAANYYIVLGLATVLSVLASATGQSLLAEGAHHPESLHENVRRAAIHIFSVLVPLMAIYLIGGRYLLLVFGPSYASQGIGLLRILSLAAPFVALNYLGNTVVNIRRLNRLFVAMSTFNSVLIIVLSLALVHDGLTALGYAWLLAQVATVAVYAFVFRRELPEFIRGTAAVRS